MIKGLVEESVDELLISVGREEVQHFFIFFQKYLTIYRPVKYSDLSAAYYHYRSPIQTAIEIMKINVIIIINNHQDNLL